MSLVGQEPVLYARSIKENIAYGLETWDLPLIHNAGRLANAHNFITEMKEQYETETGEKGVQLSGRTSGVFLGRAAFLVPHYANTKQLN